MEEVHTPPQEELNANNGVDLSIKEEMTPMATSYTETKLEINKYLQDEEMSIQELVAKHLNEEKNMEKNVF